MNKNWYNVGRLKYAEGSIVCKEMFKGGIDATLFCMAKGTEISAQAFSKSGLIFVLEGSGIMELDGEKLPMQPGVAIKIDRKAVHAIKAEDNLAFILQLS